jgi:methionine synthase II (cobalamin-independent)
MFVVRKRYGAGIRRVRSRSCARVASGHATATDCGLGGRVHAEIAWAKLEALVAGAKLASKALWR